jgi:hypothetical protein
MRKQLHISGMNLLSNCAYAWYRRYICGERVKPAAALHIGTAVHKGIEVDLGAKLETGELAELEEVQELVRDFAIMRVNEEGIESDEDKTKEETVADVLDTSVELAKVHHENIAPEIEPKHLERPFVIDMSGKFPFDLAGTMDITEVDSTLRDSKTAKRKPTSTKVDNSVQVSGYHFALKVLDGQHPKSIKFDYLIKTKKPYAITLETKRTQEDDQIFLRRFEAACKQIEAECWTPCDPDHWMCNSKWCGYYYKCPYARGKVQ